VTTTLAVLNLKVSSDVTTPLGCFLIASVTVPGGTIIFSVLFLLRVFPYATSAHACRARCIPANCSIA
jgi:hypothetical protein